MPVEDSIFIEIQKGMRKDVGYTYVIDFGIAIIANG